jgi:hypothetical protein
MRKFKTSHPRGLAFRLLLVVAGALLLMAAFAPSTNADCPACIRYYNFEGPLDPTYDVGLESRIPAFEVGGGPFALDLNTTANLPYPVASTSDEHPGLPMNVAMGDLDVNNTALGLHRSSLNPLFMDMNFISATGIYDITSVSFAVARNGNGYSLAQVTMSTDGGTTFAAITAVQFIPQGGILTLTFNIPSGTTANIPLLVLRLQLAGGLSNGNDLQTLVDNIQVNGSIIPEPATVVGGLLGVLGLGWQQRRRLIDSLRLRRRRS